MPRFLGSKYRIFWSQAETVDERDDIQHAGVRGCLEFLDIDDGIEVNHAGDLPARSGLGSSSAFTVGMLSALHTLRGESPSPAQLANEAIKVEQEVLKETVGVQDQIAFAHGGLNVTEFNTAGGYGIIPVVLPEETMSSLQSHLMLFFTGIQRHASEIAKTQIENIDRNRNEMNAISGQVQHAYAALKNGNLDEFGHMLHAGWALKRKLSDKISSPEIDKFYENAMAAGALGGNVLGPGGGGVMLFYVPYEHQDSVRAALGLIDIPVKFEHRGSQVVINA